MDVIDDTIGRSIYEEGEAPPVPPMLFGGIIVAGIVIGGIYFLMKK